MITLPFDSTKPVKGQASILINKPINEVFHFVGEQFFDNYPKWALEVTEFEPLNGKQVVIGAKARQVRKDQGQEIQSIFEITDAQPFKKISFQGVTHPYRNTYLFDIENNKDSTLLTFSFELLELELFMRPFEKLIRSAIEEGAENTVENIKNLISETEHSGKRFHEMH
ncbi:MAG TPA: hypothetical protein DGG95_04345 [Cytophagales bacterium]|nr:hypothetical protein [Cytophagales bacterium]